MTSFKDEKMGKNIFCPAFNESLFRKGQVVGVALSGGKDSVCLLDLLLAEREKLGIGVVCINVDHGIRGENSAKDSLFVKELCERKGIPLYYRKVDCPAYCGEHKTGVEEGARILRYRVFAEAVESGFCNIVATAHHRSDNAETVLFRLFRGSGPAGLCGIKEQSENGTIVRPLLRAGREEIDRYVKEKGLSYVTDETNADSAYARNFLRNEAMPLISERFPGAEEAICRFAEILARDEEFFCGEAEKYVTVSRGEISVKSGLPYALFSRAVLSVFKRLGITENYDKRHIDLLFSLQNERNGAEADLPSGISAVNDYGKITFRKGGRKEKADALPDDGIPFAKQAFSVGEQRFAIAPAETGERKALFTECREETLFPARKTLFFDGDKIPEGGVFRTRRAGDVFTPFGGKRKKLKEYLIDKKIPARFRDGLALLCRGSEVIFICGIEISDGIKVDKSTSNMLKCYLLSPSEEF